MGKNANFNAIESLEKTEEFYRMADTNYVVMYCNNNYYYEEYHNNELVKSIMFDEPIYWTILVLANDNVISFEYLFEQLLKIYPSINENKVEEVLSVLKSEYLLYYYKNYLNIVSIIDTSTCK